MTQYERDQSNLSYTNKDFGQIYPELLDLAKKLSYKWDPTISDESDPGVVLLKLAAIIGDKNNYNIDKNILELFPLSVTQLANARQLFEQLGYCMRYYRSATTTLSFTIPRDCEPEITEDDISQLSPNDTTIDLTLKENARTYSIPKFTMVSDAENNTIYTLLHDVLVSSSGVASYVDAIQGVVTHYAVNGSTLITAANLDYNNRLYFTEIDVPENGIFIQTSGKNDYDEWKQVDNLLLQSVGTKCYKFSITEDGASCYIEFPTDISSIIGSGLNISYVRTSGQSGNIGRKRLCQFYADTKATRYIVPSSSQQVTVTSENIFITNPEPVTNGKNPESIDEAYRNYQKIKTTFETLVSLNDYSDFLYLNENMSNGYVCDRTNDIQSSYTVLEADNDGVTTHTIVKDRVIEMDAESVSGEAVRIRTTEPELSAFDLRVYALAYVDDPTTSAGYERSFSLINIDSTTNNSWLEILQDTDDIKSIEHNYKEHEKNRVLMLKNKYPIVTRIIPQYKLTDVQQQEVKVAVVKKLYEQLNARVVSFGNEVEYDTIYDAILTADPRIRAITLDEITYETYAVYIDDLGITQELRIDNGSTPTATTLELWKEFRSEIYARSVLAGTTQLFNPDKKFTYSLNQENGKKWQDIYKVTTNTNIYARNEYPLTQYYTPQLQTNENIVFTAPNLIKEQAYSSYVKFVHNIGKQNRDSSTGKTVVQKDSHYTLKPGEYIIFFWKPNDDEEAPYEYVKYGYGGTTSQLVSDVLTISSTFNMQVQPNPDLAPIPDAIFANLAPGKGTTAAIPSISTTVEGQARNIEMTAYIKSLIGSSYVLTGSATVTTLQENSIDVSANTSNIFWILNETTNGNATLFKQDSTSYQLQNGEYFIYTNASKTSLTLLGSGTLISRSAPGVAWSVPAISFDELIVDPIGYLDDVDPDTNRPRWFTIEEDTVTATEMQYYQLGAGNTVKLEVIDSQLTEFLKICGGKVPTAVLFNNKGTYVELSDGQLQPISLEYFEITYTDSSNISNKLTVRMTSQDAWQAHSILNLNLSSTVMQRVDENQSITLYDSPTELSPRAEVLSNVSLLSDRAISLTGGIAVDVTSFDLTSAQPLPAAFYSCKARTNHGDWAYDGFESSVTLLANETLALHEFSLPVGSYILTIKNFSTFNKLVISCNDVPLQPATSISDDYTESGIHYLMLNVTPTLPHETVTTVHLKIEYETIARNKIIFSAPFKYTTDLSPEDFDMYWKRVGKLDTLKKFNYTYVVDEDSLVADPLDATSFLNTNHVCNKFTICQWDTLSSAKNKFVVVNKVK